MKVLSLILVSVLLTVNAKAQLSAEEPVLTEPPLLEPPAQLDPSETPEPLPIVIGEAGYGGTGCTDGNALIGHDDQGRITVLLAPMIVSGANANASFARAACGVRVPITVPAHYKLAIVEVANRGLYSVEEGDSIVLTQESGFVGVDKTPQLLELKSDGDGNLAWDSSIGQLAESSCEKTENVLSLNTNAVLKKPKAKPTSSAVALDSIEIQLMLEPCEE